MLIKASTATKPVIVKPTEHKSKKWSLADEQVTCLSKRWLKIVSMFYISGSENKTYHKRIPFQAGARFLASMIIMSDVVGRPEFVQQKCTPMMIFWRCNIDACSKMEFFTVTLTVVCDDKCQCRPMDGSAYMKLLYYLKLMI